MPSFEKNVNVGFSVEIINSRSFKLCMIMTLLGVYIAIVGLMTLTLFQGHRCVRNINCKLRFFYSCSLYCWLKCCMFATYIKKIMHNMTYVTLMCIQER